MGKKPRTPLDERVARAAEATLADRRYVTPIDVLAGIGWLDRSALERWRRGQVDTLEQVVHSNPTRIPDAMDLFRSWAAAKGLRPSETPYVARTAERQTLRFSRSGDPATERSYRTHWVSPDLSETQRERLREKAGRAPDLVVVRPLHTDWKCHRCDGTGDLLMMEDGGPVCLRCMGLADLEFLPAGDALLTRRVKARSEKTAVVVRFSRSRGRYERQGLLVEPRALAEVDREIAARRGD